MMPVRVGVGVIVTRGDRVLLMRRRGSHGSGTWSPPGGHLDPGETLEACAARETREETGIEVRDIRFRAITNDVFEGEGRHYVTIWMETNNAAGDPVVNAPEEMSDVGWFRWGELPTPLFLPLRNLLAGHGYPAGG
jgi:8-oxo-dGTP diphosphatase